MKVISMDVNCPWCGAEPGQLCTEPKDFRTGAQSSSSESGGTPPESDG